MLPSYLPLTADAWPRGADPSNASLPSLLTDATGPYPSKASNLRFTWQVVVVKFWTTPGLRIALEVDPNEMLSRGRRLTAERSPLPFVYNRLERLINLPGSALSLVT